jgi:LTXXQ motif family protein
MECSVAEPLETEMKKKSLVIGGIATAAVLAGGWALAQPAGFGPGGMGPGGPGGMRGMHGMMGPGMHGQMGPGAMHGGPGFAFDPARLDTLKTEIGIKPAQEQAWTKYTKAIQDAATAMKTARDSVNPDAVSKLGPQERFAFATKMREQAQKQHETVTTAANELLATLDDTQKAKAQQTLPGLAFGRGPMHAAGTRGPQHQH